MMIIKIISITSLTLVGLAVLESRVQAAKLILPSQSETQEQITKPVVSSSLNSQDSVNGESGEPGIFQIKVLNEDDVLPTVSFGEIEPLNGNEIEPLNGSEIPEPSALVGIASVGAIVGLNRIFKKGNKKHK